MHIAGAYIGHESPVYQTCPRISGPSIMTGSSMGINPIRSIRNATELFWFNRESIKAYPAPIMATLIVITGE